MREVRVIGFGLAGACVALALKKVGAKVRIFDEGGGATLVAAGLVNPVAGRDFEPSWELGQYLPEALEFYRDLERESGRVLFREMPILRKWLSEKDRKKFEGKLDVVGEWVDEVNDEGVRWKGGGWLDAREFLKAAREVMGEKCFLEEGRAWLAHDDGTERELGADGGPAVQADAGGGRDVRATLRTVRCTGARGLRAGEFGEVPKLCAKGEILTLKIPHFPASQILNGGGWMIPIGGDLFKAGATYEWDHLDSGPTPEGRAQVEKIVRFLTDDAAFEVVDHEAGIRPIINFSEPVVEFSEKWGWMMNGLGSKGVIYAPKTARILVERLVAGF